MSCNEMKTVEHSGCEGVAATFLHGECGLIMTFLHKLGQKKRDQWAVPFARPLEVPSHWGPTDLLRLIMEALRNVRIKSQNCCPRKCGNCDWWPFKFAARSQKL